MNIQIKSTKIIIPLLVFSIMLLFNAGFGLASESILDGKVFTGQTGKIGKRMLRKMMN